MKEPRDTPEFLSAIESARGALLFQMVRLLMRDRAMANDQTAADVMAHGEEIKVYFETNIPPEISATGAAGASALMNAAVDAFFNVLADDVATLRGSRDD